MRTRDRAGFTPFTEEVGGLGQDHPLRPREELRITSPAEGIFSSKTHPFGHKSVWSVHWWPAFCSFSVVSQGWEGSFLGGLSIDIVLLKQWTLGRGQYSNHRMWVEAELFPERGRQVNGRQSSLRALIVKILSGSFLFCELSWSEFCLLSHFFCI